MPNRGTNCIHSAQLHNCTSDGRCVTHFPSGPSLAATFDREVIQDIGGVVSDELRGAFNAKNWLDDGMNGLGLDCWSPGRWLARYVALSATLFARLYCYLVALSVCRSLLG